MDFAGDPSVAMAGMDALSHPAESYGNADVVEAAWAIQAYEHAEVHFNLITSVDPSLLRLCPMDNDIYEMFKKDFPDVNIEIVDEEVFKSPKAKEEWRVFCNHFEGKVKNFNFGSLLRVDCTGGYNEHNTIFVTRIQFLAVEIARNREGLNNKVYMEALKKKEEQKKEEKEAR